MNRSLLAISAIFLFAGLAFAKKQDAISLFGVKLLAEANNPTLTEKIRSEIATRTPYYQSAFDPDCYYKESGNQKCGGKDKLPENFDQLIADIESETDKKFTLVDKVGEKPKRDYGGIAQGAVLEELARKFPEGWFANFAGDIYVAPKTKLKDPIFVTDPLVGGMPYAVVDMDSGWVSSSHSPAFEGQVRDPKQQTFDFDKIILFAQPDFNGARLDAWSTALINGGKPLLTKLVKTKKYDGQWAYMYFEDGGKVVCSPKIKCNFKNPKERLIKIQWTPSKG